MRVLRDPALAACILDPGLRQLVQQRFIDLCAGEDYESDVHGYLIVVEPGDRVAALEEESGCPILRNLVGTARFGEAEFSPCFEVLEEHPSCYEMVFVPSDGDFGIVIFIPKREGIDAELLAMCAQYAVPAPELSLP